MKCFIGCSLANDAGDNLAPVEARTQVWTKLILWTFLRLPGFRSGAANLSRESGHGESEIGADLRVSGRSIPENDQRQVQAADRLGPEGWPEALWRDQDWTAARIGRQLGNRAPGAQPRIEGADRDRADRPQGFWCRSAQG